MDETATPAAAAPPPLPLPPDARLYRLKLTGRTTYIMARSRDEARRFFTTMEGPLTVPPAPHPSDEKYTGDDGLKHWRMTPAFAAWFGAYQPLLFHKVHAERGEFLLDVDEAPEGTHVPDPWGPPACQDGTCGHPEANLTGGRG